MKIKIILSVVLVLLSLPFSLANEEIVARGKYIYDETGTLSLKDNLALSAPLWKLDDKTGYETVYVFPRGKLTVDQMGEWFNKHGVGKKTDNGLAMFVFPDNAVYGMIGRGHDRIATPYLTTFAPRPLGGLEKDKVKALNNLSIDLKKQLDTTTTTYERVYSTGKAVIDNLHIIMGWASLIALVILLFKQRDGFQWNDLLWPAVILILTLFVVGIMSIDSDDNVPSYSKEFGAITSTKLKSHEYTERHCSGSGDDEICWWDHHTEYYNYVEILSYDFKPYSYRFYSKDNDWAWERKERELLGLYVNIKGNSVFSVDFPVRDNSGGQTDYYGAWVLRK